jgi:hypothetical protein
MGSTYPGVREFLPRLLLGGILINTAGWWGKLAIDVNNAARGVLARQTLPTSSVRSCESRARL